MRVIRYLLTYCFPLLTAGVIAATPAPAILAITNAASGQSGAIAPGEEITIWGVGFGPSQVVQAAAANGQYPVTLSDTHVSFDGVAAPVIAVANGQADVMVPFELAGRSSTMVTLTYAGTASQPFSASVSGVAMGIYTLNQTGAGQGAVLDPDYIGNGPDRPAFPMETVMVYMTGLGVTNPPSATGHVTPIDGSVLNRAPLQMAALVGGVQATITYAGSAPGFVNGVMQVNVSIPSGVPDGEVSLIVYGAQLESPFSSGSAQPGITIWTRASVAR